MEELTTEKKRWVVPTEKIIVEPVMRARNSLIQDPEHEAFFLYGTSTITYCLPEDRQGNLLNPFSCKEEQLWLEGELDLDLNYHKRTNNYWHELRVKLGKNSRTLDLQNPKHYIEYLVLKANSLFIAPDSSSMNDKATYRYALVSADYRIEEAANEVDLEMEAFMALGKIKDDPQAMIDFLKVYGNKVSPVSKRTFLVAEIKKIIESDVKKFLATINDRQNYEVKLLIARAVEAGAVIKQGRKYTLPGGDNLCGPGSTPTLEHAVEYLQAPANQDILSLLKARVENAKS